MRTRIGRRGGFGHGIGFELMVLVAVVSLYLGGALAIGRHYGFWAGAVGGLVVVAAVATVIGAVFWFVGRRRPRE